MEFNVPKCKIMHMGNNNPKYLYNMARQPLATTTEERDIGVTITSNLKPTAQCKKAAKTAQTVLGQIGRSFHYRDRHVFVKFYKQYVRPHLEFSTQAWSPWTGSDIECLEKVQQRAVNMVSGLAGTSYKEKLQEVGLLSLEERRHQADMHLMHKIMHGEGGLEANVWFERASSAAHATRSGADPFNVKVKSGRLEVRRDFYSMRVITDWNRIPSEIKSRPGTSRFKAEYRRIRAGTMHPAQHGER
jgi:ribonuclease P/MRP protein subunit RPP40